MVCFGCAGDPDPTRVKMACLHDHSCEDHDCSSDWSLYRHIDLSKVPLSLSLSILLLLWKLRKFWGFWLNRFCNYWKEGENITRGLVHMLDLAWNWSEYVCFSIFFNLFIHHNRIIVWKSVSFRFLLWMRQILVVLNQCLKLGKIVWIILG